MNKKHYLLLAAIVGLAAGACKKIESLPAQPRIEFTSFTVFDTIDILGNSAKGGRLKFYFEDGDGDLGLTEPSKDQADTTNLFLSLFRKTGGRLVPASENDPLRPSDYRIPYMERTGVNRILKGTISVTFVYLFYEATDTIKYDFYMRDRAQNLSNTASTPEIAVGVNSVYKPSAP